MSDEPRLGPVARRLVATERVLCVEDEQDIAAFLRAYFRAAGYDLVHLDPDDAGAVVAAVEEHRPDCILLDVRLRGFSGMEAYRRLRADERWAFLPIIVVSASSAADATFQAPRGLDAFVAKPFNTNTLADLVRDRIDRARELARRGRDDELQLMTQGYLEARLADEMSVAGDDGSFAFALIRLRSMGRITAEVGREGRDHVLRQLLEHARGALPDDVVVGLTDEDEVALILPSRPLSQSEALVREAIESVARPYTFPGGATVVIDVAGGLASYPRHATDIDGLFMAADSALTDACDHDTPLEVAL